MHKVISLPWKLGTLTIGKPPEVTEPGMSPARRLALRQAESIADNIMSVINSSRQYALLATLIVQVVSYEDQHDYLRRLGMRLLAYTLIPVVFDLVTIMCVKVIGATAIKTGAKIAAGVVVVASAGASGYVNIMASPSMAVAIIYAMVVLFIPAGELIKALIAADNGKILEIESGYTKLAETPVVTEVTEDVRPTRRTVRRIAPAERDKAVESAKALLSTGSIRSVRLLRSAVPNLSDKAAKELVREFKSQLRDPIAAVATVNRADNPAPVSPAHAVKR